MIKIEINDEEIQAALARAQALLADLSPVMDDIGRQLIESTKLRIVAGESPDGSSFAPRSETTLARYARQGKVPKGGPLRLNDYMRQSSLHHNYGPDFTEVGSSAIQAAVMQFGAAQGAFGAVMGRTKPTAKRPKSQDYFAHLPWGNIPARPFLGISDEDRTDILDIIAEALTASLGQA